VNIMPFDSLPPAPELPPDLSDELHSRRIRDILAGWSPRTIDAPPRRWRPLAVLQAGFSRLTPLSDKRARPC
jgi:hypothetical protein